jgi:hypothetical protein
LLVVVVVVSRFIVSGLIDTPPKYVVALLSQELRFPERDIERGGIEARSRDSQHSTSQLDA